MVFPIIISTLAVDIRITVYRTLLFLLVADHVRQRDRPFVETTLRDAQENVADTTMVRVHRTWLELDLLDS